MSADSAAPTSALPDTALVTIEFPGLIGSSCASLERALATLSPHVGPAPGSSSARSALAHLATLLARGGRIVECRLPGDDRDPMDMYRHALLGDVVAGDGLVVRLRRRVWRRTDTEEVCRQYTVELLGAAHATVRFRRMADFAFRPGLPAGATVHPTLALHSALQRLDVDAMRQYRLPSNTEDYEVPTADGRAMQSNLAMIPPPFFSRLELPFPYGYRQNPTSSLQTVPYGTTSKRSRRTARKAEADTSSEAIDQRVLTRYLNRSRWRSLAPIAIKFADTGTVPSGPDTSLEQVQLTDRQQEMLERLRRQLEVRPVWSRLALLNQFPASEARAILQSKEVFSLVAYTFADGPWRDTLVRFGYDPRREPSSRFLQRIHLRGKTRAPVMRGVFKAEYGDVLPGSAVRVGPHSARAEAPSASHVFDGKKASYTRSTFQLCDITELSIAALVQGSGEASLRSAPDVRTMVVQH